MAQENLTDERPVIDRVYDLLASDKQPRNFYDIVDQLIDEDLSEDDRTEFMARLYTNMNIDGRFLCIGDNFWGLKTWYPVEQQDEEVASKITSKKTPQSRGRFRRLRRSR
ncbi:DNA-directed RNA polymerase subunit delta [Caenibacillus caldisaponilyticus]|uniref:DNA-directed RNA polymerase subunit delta n=1 Tax=Caenibacillus caldisaponilyticus TaxID=1674942 RepID=UPI0013018F42|nr:DNA-directed RNA polymerase subunit delta [Caenibacillus caldisaponilyticus]